jgi:preprotein translocase subunit SecE
MGDSAKTDKTVKQGFFKGVKAEFKKISWPDKNSLTKQSIAVVVISVCLAVVISLLDMAIKYGVNILTTLQ